MMKRDEKKQIVDELHEKFLKSKIVIATDYKGLDVETVSRLRRKLKEAKIEYRVVKNTLLKRASDDTDVAPLQPYFKGTTAIAISYDDPVAPAKILSDFAKENEKLGIRVGVMNAGIIAKDGIRALSALPSREVLLAQLLSAMNAVPGSFVRLLANIPQGLVNVLSAWKAKKEETPV